uniref:Uncharacterized protein n=1 Tax=Enterobacter hormaechei TaxID=158836 RepID=A0A3S7QGQ3_9ENTR|nr:hypothetical protein [Enterobacter hormaechei]
MLASEVFIIQKSFKWRVQVATSDVFPDHRQSILERATSSIQPHSIDSLTTHHCLNNIGECRRVELFNTKNRIAFLLNCLLVLDGVLCSDR